MYCRWIFLLSIFALLLIYHLPDFWASALTDTFVLLVSFYFCIVIYWNNSFLFLFPFSILIWTELTGCYHSLLSALFGQHPLLQHKCVPMTQKWAVKLLSFVSFVIVKTGSDLEERNLKTLRSSTHLCYFFFFFFFRQTNS